MIRPRLHGTDCPRRGNVLCVTAICLIPMLGVTALALDCGLLMSDHRKAQRAADAAALAGAVDLFTHYNKNGGNDKNGTAVTSAQTTATANGFSSGVTVNVFPSKYQAGQFAGTPDRSR